MPLTRLSEGFDDQLEGVYFGMKDGSGNNIRCFVRAEALEDASIALGDQEDQKATFLVCRSDIEAIASSKYAAGLIEGDVTIIITSRDLNPELFESS